MKYLFWLCLFLTLLDAKEHQQFLGIRCHNGTILSTKIILQALQITGQKAKITHVIRDDQGIHIEVTTSANKPFEGRYFSEILSENGVLLTKATVKDKKWLLLLDSSQAHWEIPNISPNEGSGMDKSPNPSWFRVDESSALTIEAPYSGKWYPEVALLDASMNVLESVREFTPKTRLDFSLPQGATYLKVSNANGMKLLKEGTSIEHIQEQQ